MSNPAARGRLFRKYVVVFLLLVGGVLLVSSAVDLYFSYQETKAALVRIEREQAVAAAARIEQFILDIERQLRWTTQAAFDDPAAALEQREWLEGQFSLADIAYAPHLAFLVEGGFDFASTPRVRSWLDRLLARPAWQQARALVFDYY